MCYSLVADVDEEKETNLDTEPLKEDATTSPVDDDDHIEVVVTDVDATENVISDELKGKEMSSGKDSDSSDKISCASNYCTENEITLDGCPWEVESTKEFWKSFAKLDWKDKSTG